MTIPGIVLGTEPWPSKYIADWEVFPKNYVCYLKDRNNHGSGVFILVDKNIISREIDVKYNQSESVWAQLRLKNGKMIIICSF